MSQQEDDLRALAKIMDFLRAVSIILVVVHLYWYCYEAIQLWGVNIGVVDRILMNFHRTAGLFGNQLYTKLFALTLMGLSCLGTKGVKEEHITWSKIWAFMGVGLVFFFLNWWILALPLPIEANAALYVESRIGFNGQRQGEYPPIEEEKDKADAHECPYFRPRDMLLFHTFRT